MLLYEHIIREPLPSEALTMQLEVVPMMVALREGDGSNFYTILCLIAGEGGISRGADIFLDFYKMEGC